MLSGLAGYPVVLGMQYPCSCNKKDVSEEVHQSTFCAVSLQSDICLDSSMFKTQQQLEVYAMAASAPQTEHCYAYPAAIDQLCSSLLLL